ncbi:MAG: AraC family transcriptional regulator ligand-binding domain-containing protein [Oleispira sp.]|nr:AraC family transcriptional regulator ligand-binding domain-containing protein [Oleispira sp.]
MSEIPTSASISDVEAGIEACSRLGADKEKLFSVVGITQQKQCRSNHRVPTQKVFDLWHAAIESTSNNLLPIEAGMMANTIHRTLLVNLVCVSSSIQDALGYATKYMHLSQDAIKLRLVTNKNLSQIIFEHPGYNAEQVRHQVEYMTAMMLSIGRLMAEGREIDEFTCEVHFSHKNSVSSQEYTDLLSAETFFASNCTKIIISTAVMDLTNFAAFPEVEVSMLRSAQKLHQELKKDHGFISQLQQYLKNNLAEKSLTINTVAECFSITPRTLQRRLKENNTSFKNILDELRKEKSLELMLDTSFTLSDIALAIGFSQTTGFNFAFKRWMNSTPNDYRKLLLSDK